MKTVTLRVLRRDTNWMDAAAGGEEILVTRFGKPYVRIVSAQQSRTFIGAGKHLGAQDLVTSAPIPKSEWKGLH